MSRSFRIRLWRHMVLLVIEEITDEDDQGWGIDSTSSELEERSQGRPYSRNSSSSSPWLSLVAWPQQPKDELRRDYQRMHRA